MAHTVLQRPQRRGLPPQGPRQRRSRRRRTRRRTLRVLAGILLIGLCLSTASYVRALTYPGQATWQQRSVSWLRDHGGSPIVNRAENWYYTRHAPATSPPDPASLPTTMATTATPMGGPHGLPALSGLPGEGAWVPGRTGRGGQPAAYTTFFQPDPAHASVVAGAAWIRAGATTAHLVAGTTQPGGNGWPGNAQVPPTAVPHLVAVFNSGFKMNDITGGYYSHGRTAKPLRCTSDVLRLPSMDRYCCGIAEGKTGGPGSAEKHRGPPRAAARKCAWEWTDPVSGCADMGWFSRR